MPTTAPAALSTSVSVISTVPVIAPLPAIATQSVHHDSPKDQPVEPNESEPQVYNRLSAIMAHTLWYAFEPQARLAKDAGVSRSTVSRLITGKINPSFRLVQAITEALSRRISDTLNEPLAAPLDPREVFSNDGFYPTASVCKLTACPGCLPEDAYDRHGNRTAEYRTAQPGDWCRSPQKTIVRTKQTLTAT